MNLKIKLFMLVLLLMLGDLCYCQSKTGTLKELTLSEFRPVIINSHMVIFLDDYIEITSNGIYKVHTNAYNGIGYSAGDQDTSYRISKGFLAKLAIFFNNKKQLRSHLMNGTAQLGGNFAGPYEFITYVTKKNVKEELMIAANCDGELRNILDSILLLPQAKIVHKNKIYHNKIMENDIIAYFKTCRCLLNSNDPAPKVSKLN